MSGVSLSRPEFGSLVVVPFGTATSIGGGLAKLNPYFSRELSRHTWGQW
jgi:hypothetical protein